jgi:hypothetical protein
MRSTTSSGGLSVAMRSQSGGMSESCPASVTAETAEGMVSSIGIVSPFSEIGIGAAREGTNTDRYRQV